MRKGDEEREPKKRKEKRKITVAQLKCYNVA
jgi:hypothetical protein